jgi:predicted ester cyclase
MTREDIADLLARRQDAFDRRDVEALSSMHAVDGIVETPLGGGTARGRQAIEDVYRTAFHAWAPTTTFLQEELLIDDDRAVSVQRISGTDSGGIMGMPPTGRPFVIVVAHILSFRDGAIATERRIYDFTGFLAQLGIIKVKPA